jgi:hypothetical protein
MPPGFKEAPAPRLPGVLIGKGGDTINTLCRDSGASINVSRDEAQGNDARQWRHGRPSENGNFLRLWNTYQTWMYMYIYICTHILNAFSGLA